MVEMNERLDQCLAKIPTDYQVTVAEYKELAREYDVIIVRPDSDDLVAWYSPYDNDETGMFHDPHIITSNGLFSADIERRYNDDPRHQFVSGIIDGSNRGVPYVRVVEENGYNIHYTGENFRYFNILEDGEIYGRGLIIPYEDRSFTEIEDILEEIVNDDFYEVGIQVALALGL